MGVLLALAGQVITPLIGSALKEVITDKTRSALGKPVPVRQETSGGKGLIQSKTVLFASMLLGLFAARLNLSDMEVSEVASLIGGVITWGGVIYGRIKGHKKIG